MKRIFDCLARLLADKEMDQIIATNAALIASLQEFASQEVKP